MLDWDGCWGKYLTVSSSYGLPMSIPLRCFYVNLNSKNVFWLWKCPWLITSFPVPVKPRGPVDLYRMDHSQTSTLHPSPSFFSNTTLVSLCWRVSGISRLWTPGTRPMRTGSELVVLPILILYSLKFILNFYNSILFFYFYTRRPTFFQTT